MLWVGRSLGSLGGLWELSIRDRAGVSGWFGWGGLSGAPRLKGSGFTLALGAGVGGMGRGVRVRWVWVGVGVVV